MDTSNIYIYIYGYIYIYIYMDTSTDTRRHTQCRFIHLQIQVHTHIDVFNTGSAWPAGPCSGTAMRSQFALHKCEAPLSGFTFLECDS